MPPRPLLVSLILALSALALAAAPPPELKLSFTTASPGGDKKYEPRNILAAWVETPDGAYVRTLGLWAKAQKRNLAQWRKAAGPDAQSPAPIPDALTAATQKNYGHYTLTWNLADAKAQTVPDGKYRIRIELTNHNAPKNQYIHTTIPVEIGPNPLTLHLPEQDGFKNIRIDFAGRAPAAPPQPAPPAPPQPGK